MSGSRVFLFTQEGRRAILTIEWISTQYYKKIGDCPCNCQLQPSVFTQQERGDSGEVIFHYYRPLWHEYSDNISPIELFFCALRSHDFYHAAKLLYENKIDINGYDERGNGWTPLHEAVYYCNTESIKFLLRQEKIDVLKPSQKGITLLGMLEKKMQEHPDSEGFKQIYFLIVRATEIADFLANPDDEPMNYLKAWQLKKYPIEIVLSGEQYQKRVIKETSLKIE
jgi:hypothetical protein